VQLPFLQSLLTRFSLLPVLVGDCDPQKVGALLDELWGGPETLVVISSDLSHFHPYDEACEIDASTCARILQKSTGLSGTEACGARALNGLMSARHCQDMNVDLLAACNSGDTAGNRERVVGYGAFQLY
jgi:AmmeMemoRadiSam system protein B